MAEHAGHEERRGTNHLVLVAAQPAGATTCRETGTWAGTGTVVPVAGLERLTEPLDGARDQPRCRRRDERSMRPAARESNPANPIAGS